MADNQHLLTQSLDQCQKNGFQQGTEWNLESARIQEYNNQEIQVQAVEGSMAVQQEETVFVSIVIIRAESGEKFAFDLQKIPIFTQKRNLEQSQQQYNSHGQCYYLAQSLLDHNALRLFLPIGCHIYLHSGCNNQELTLIEKNFTNEKQMIQQPLQNQLHPLPSNKVIVITFKSPDNAGDIQSIYEDRCMENEEKSQDSQKSIQEIVQQHNTDKPSKNKNKYNMDEHINNQNTLTIDENEQSQQNFEENNSDFCAIDVPDSTIRDNDTTNVKITNQQYKRVNERTIREALQLVQLWRDLYKNANERLGKGMYHISLAQVASQIRLCKKKTLDYYFLLLRKAEIYGYDFSTNLDYKMGCVREFITEMAETHQDIKDRHEKEIVFQLPDHDILPVDQDIVNQLLKNATSKNTGTKKNKTKTHSQDEIIEKSFQSNNKRKSQNQQNPSNSDKKGILFSDKVQTEHSQGENVLSEQNQDNKSKKNQPNKEEILEKLKYNHPVVKHFKKNEEFVESYGKHEEPKFEKLNNLLKNSIPRDPRAEGRNSTPAFSAFHYQTQFGLHNLVKLGDILIPQQQHHLIQNHFFNQEKQVSPSFDIFSKVDENSQQLFQIQFQVPDHRDHQQQETVFDLENNYNNSQQDHFEGSSNLNNHNIFSMESQSYYYQENSFDPNNMDKSWHNYESFNDLYPLNGPRKLTSQQMNTPNLMIDEFDCPIQQQDQQQHMWLQNPEKKQNNEYYFEDNPHSKMVPFDDEIIDDYRRNLSFSYLENFSESKQQENDQSERIYRQGYF